MKLTSEQIAELRQKVEAATPGKWIYNEYFNCIQVQPGFRPVCSFSLIPSMANRDYIAAANPQTIGALLDDLEEARKELERLKAAFHVSMVRAYPAKSHNEISVEIAKVMGEGPNLIDLHNGDAAMWIEDGKVRTEWSKG